VNTTSGLDWQDNIRVKNPIEKKFLNIIFSVCRPEYTSWKMKKNLVPENYLKLD
jgi:hypothetical protein